MPRSTPKRKCNNLLNSSGVLHSLSTKGGQEEALKLAICFFKTWDFSLRCGRREGAGRYVWGVGKSIYWKEAGVLLSWWAGVSSAWCQPQMLTVLATTKSNPCNHFPLLGTHYTAPRFGRCNTRNALTNESESHSNPTEMGQGLKHFPCEKCLSKPSLLEPKEVGASREELTAHPQLTRKTTQQGAACTEKLSSLHPWRFARCTGKRPEQLNLNSTRSLPSGEGYACGPPKVLFNLNESDLCCCLHYCDATDKQ